MFRWPRLDDTQSKRPYTFITGDQFKFLCCFDYNAFITFTLQCPPCQTFTPELTACYKELKSQGKNFEIVFCSSDHDEQQFNDYYKDMPWLAIPLNDKRKEELSDHFNVEGG